MKAAAEGDGLDFLRGELVKGGGLSGLRRPLGDIIAIVRPCKQAQKLPKRQFLFEKAARYESELLGAGLCSAM